MTSFSLAGQGLKLDTEEDLKKHIGALSNPAVTHIDLSGNTFGVSACEALSSVLSSKSNLESIDLHDIFTSRSLAEIPPALTFILTALLNCHKLQTIDLSDNAFGLNTKDPLVNFLAKHTSLKHLILNNNGMGPIAGTSIAQALGELALQKQAARGSRNTVPDLESIVCGRNRLENGSMAAWAKAFEAHKNMKSVKMTQNGIRPEGISQLIGSGLSHCKNLQVLDLQDNTFTISGATTLATTVQKWSKLTELGVGDSLLGARGAIKLFKSLGEGNNATLEVLKLQFNDINSAGVKELLQAAEQMPALRRVELNGNKFEEDDASIQDLGELLSERKTNFGKDDDSDDHWGLDELDELEGEDSDEEDAESEDDERETILKDADDGEAAKVSQKEDEDVDELASVLAKTKV